MTAPGCRPDGPGYVGGRAAFARFIHGPGPTEPKRAGRDIPRLRLASGRFAKGICLPTMPTPLVLPRHPIIGMVLVAVLLATAGPALTADVTGQASVIDGDTIEIHGTRIRLWGIDAPEGTQLCRGEDSIQYPCGAKAANDLDAFIARRPVSCTPISRDQYGQPSIPAIGARALVIDVITALFKRTKLGTIRDRKLIWDIGHGSLAARLVKVRASSVLSSQWAA